MQAERTRLFEAIEGLSEYLSSLRQMEELWKETLSITGLDNDSRDNQEVQRTLQHVYDELRRTTETLETTRKQFRELSDAQRELNDLKLAGGTEVGEA